MASPSPISLAYAQEQLQAWYKALEAASTGGSYSIGGRTLTRQDVPTIRAEIQRWNNSVLAIQASLQGKTRAMGSQAAFPTPGSGSGGIIPDGLWQDWRT